MGRKLIIVRLCGAIFDFCVVSASGEKMLKDSLAATYRKVIYLQALLTAAFALIALVVSGYLAAGSTLSGGVAVVVGSVVYAVVARENKVSAVSGRQVLGRHVLAEVAKVVVTLALVLGAYASGWFAAGWLLAAMGVALGGHVLAALFIK
jgi:F0F1-type ATP synthase assembly protein I